jgi:hypothetical protein
MADLPEHAKGGPILWEISRRFNVTYKITQCATGVDVAIMSLSFGAHAKSWNGWWRFLRESGITIEFGRSPPARRSP